MPAGGVTGSRYPRLASDNPDPANTGFIVQNMGTMVAGETYTITGDLLGGVAWTIWSCRPPARQCRNRGR